MLDVCERNVKLKFCNKRSQRRKWIHCFDTVQAVIFVTAMSDFDQTLKEERTVNRIQESLEESHN